MTKARPARSALLLLLYAAMAFATSAQEEEEALVLRGVNVIPMDQERVIEEQTVVIERGRIAQMAPVGQAELPARARTIDASGMFLMPGLAEMHAHVPTEDDTEEDAQYREDVLFLYLANGITLARNMIGQPVHLTNRAQLARGELDGPRLVTSGPPFHSRLAKSPAEATEEVWEQAESGYDFIKILGGISSETFDALADTAEAAGLRLAGHVPESVGLERALQRRYASIDHFDRYMPSLVDPTRAEGVEGGFFGYRLAPFVEPARIEREAQRTRLAGVWNVPTESIMRSAFLVDLDRVREERPEFKYLPQEVVDGWFEWVTEFRSGEDYDHEAGRAYIETRLALLGALHEAGAGLLLGSDAPQWFNVPGFSLHREMEYMAEAGLSPYEVLKTGTVNPAVFLGEDAIFGRVEKGLRAELVLLEANPLEDLTNTRKIAGVIRRGKWYSKETIDQRLAEIEARYER